MLPQWVILVIISAASMVAGLAANIQNRRRSNSPLVSSSSRLVPSGQSEYRRHITRIPVTDQFEPVIVYPHGRKPSDCLVRHQ